MNPLSLVCSLLVLSATLACDCLGDDFDETILPILRERCTNCHSSEKVEGELDLQRFASTAMVKKEIEVWEQVLHQLELGEMPRRMPSR